MKKILISFFLFLSILLVPNYSFAWRPSEFFIADISFEGIPGDTKYIDILTKIDSDSKYYTNNTQLLDYLNFSQDCELNKYNVDGYQSLSLHVLDNAGCDDYCDRMLYNMIPYVDLTFDDVDKIIPKIDNKETTLGYFNYDYYDNDGNEWFSLHCEYSNMNNVIHYFTENGASLNDKFIHCEYRIDANENGASIEKIVINCKYFKMAYIDKDGNIISTSQSVNLYKKRIKTFNLAVSTEFSLSGETLDYYYSDSFNWAVFIIIFIVLISSLFLAAIGFLVFLSVRYYKRRRKIIN